MADLRPAVRQFAERMEERLVANDHKGGWKGCSDRYLLSKLTEEYVELFRAVEHESAERVAKEAADLANIAMMLADNALQWAEGG